MEPYDPKKRNLFVLYSWGRTATAWLARVLNAHEDIFCIHQPILNEEHGNKSGKLRLMSEVFLGGGFGGHYRNVGFTHGVPSYFHHDIEAGFNANIRVATIQRHPIKRINSATKTLSSIPRRFYNTYEELKKMSAHDFPDDNLSLAHYNFCKSCNRIIHESKFLIFKMEDLVTNPKTLNILVRYVTWDECGIELERLRSLQKKPINQRFKKSKSPQEIFDGWTADQQLAFKTLLAPEAVAIYRKLGYDLPA